jgi:hypothetical protein
MPAPGRSAIHAQRNALKDPTPYSTTTIPVFGLFVKPHVFGDWFATGPTFVGPCCKPGYCLISARSSPPRLDPPRDEKETTPPWRTLTRNPRFEHPLTRAYLLRRLSSSLVRTLDSLRLSATCCTWRE